MDGFIGERRELFHLHSGLAPMINQCLRPVLNGSTGEVALDVALAVEVVQNPPALAGEWLPVL